MILVDTSVWIDFFRGTDSIYRKSLHDLIDGEDDLCLTAIHLTEILQGIKVDTEFARTKRYLLSFPTFLTRDIATYLHAAEIYRLCRRKGKIVRKTADCIIAAVAIENDLTLFHNDRDFDKIESCTRLKVLA